MQNCLIEHISELENATDGQTFHWLLYPPFLGDSDCFIRSISTVLPKGLTVYCILNNYSTATENGVEISEISFQVSKIAG